MLVEDAVPVGIVLGAPVLVLDAISVFGQVRTFIRFVGDSVTIAVVRAWSPADRDHGTDAWDPHGLVESQVDADQYVRVAVMAEGNPVVGRE